MSDHVAAAAETREAGLTLHPLLATKVNFASAQNGVAVIKRLGIENGRAEPVENIRLTLSANPAILREKTWTIDRIPPGTTLQLTDLETPLDTTLLGGLDEAEFGQIEFRLTAQDEGDVTQSHRIEMLARDEWGGLAEMDNILAAFVSPTGASLPPSRPTLPVARCALPRAGTTGRGTSQPTRASIVSA